MTQEFLITVQTDEWTHFVENPEFFSKQLHRYAELLFKNESQGSVPAVTVAIVDEKFLGERLLTLLEAAVEEDEHQARAQDDH
jgi:hypothetical protein